MKNHPELSEKAIIIPSLKAAEHSVFSNSTKVDNLEIN
jgi:hypothetical protein